ncbi:hypothetical protein TrCOL_g5696 [Triparma columacea]|uniref:Uncharacterized protein n=1 Tax=Triparma columacea TaxID=722753 RepID=A0A9W7GMF6_9STRA|nr:hypothetical protein TrCOL_g5696 [Triparma columacea]
MVRNVTLHGDSIPPSAVSPRLSYLLSVKRAISDEGCDSFFTKTLFKCVLEKSEDVGRGDFLRRVQGAYGSLEGRLEAMEKERDRAKGVCKEAEDVASRISAHLQTREDTLLSNFVNLLNYKKAEIDELKRKINERGGKGKEKDTVVEEEGGRGGKKEKKTKKQSEEERQQAYVNSNKADHQLQSIKAHLNLDSSPSKPPPNNNAEGGMRIKKGAVRNAREIHGGGAEDVMRMMDEQDAKDSVVSRPGAAQGGRIKDENKANALHRQRSPPKRSNRKEVAKGEGGGKRRKVKDPMLESDSSDDEGEKGRKNVNRGGGNRRIAKYPLLDNDSSDEEIL